ncbi:hypothetical protein JR316_0007998 [Psilocybe cubensis]|uniref:Uncharacterized protein n=1 Tax=Psilocybe cubensis TaxID=181762 RepID=A0ACB8GUU9_PSICU|nr:hypothetical protein JR316_0007998 [Psilocybe cubensis]KAH9479408.1 hypothetical protein JR316_0007998 [Psilocybe cubensis]
MKTPSSPDAKVKKTPVSASKGPKKVDVSLPGPSPKRARRDSEESIKPPKVKKSSMAAVESPIDNVMEHSEKDHKASVSAKKPSRARRDSNESVRSVKQPKAKTAPGSCSGTPAASSPNETNQPSDELGVFKKPESIRKPKSKGKAMAAEDDFDDSISIADSTVSTTKTRRNESERIEYFKNQAECGKLEPHSAECIICNKVVNLGRKQTYAVRPWEIHRARCDKKAAEAIPTTPERADASPDVEEAVATTILSPAFDPMAARRPSEADRKEYLEADKQISELEKHRACCNKCHKWIDLSPTQPYATGNWVKHKIRCSDAIPSNRVAAAKRKLLIVNDKQVKSFTPHKIDCAFCGGTVPLEGEGDFNLTCWDEHKEKCTKSVPVSRSDNINSIAFPSRFSRPPHSSTSTDGSLAVDAALGSASGIKRPRQDSEVALDEETRASARPRTSAYIPPDIEPPSSILGWFMLPFHSFVRGFKESLKDKS